MMISHIEKLTGKPAHELFDLMVGSATGGILALALAYPGPGKPAQSKVNFSVLEYVLCRIRGSEGTSPLLERAM